MRRQEPNTISSFFDRTKKTILSAFVSEDPTEAEEELLDSEQPSLRDELESDEHLIPLTELLQRLGTDKKDGLSNIHVAELQEKFGKNYLTPPPNVPEIVKFLSQLFGGFASLLWVASGLCLSAFFMDEENNLDYLYLGFVLLTVVILTGLFSYLQESKSTSLMAAFKKLSPEFAVVIREGQRRKIDATELVVGDIIELYAGDKVPADIRIISAVSLKVDNSSLTGESEPQTLGTEMTSENFFESKNIAFYTSLVVEGKGRAVVVNCGDNTIIGKIAALASSTTELQTPIGREINYFIRIISYVAFGIGLMFFIFGLFIYSPLDNLIFVIGIIVANVPEGLMATVTVTLSLTAKRMAAKNVLVKNLESVETLGSTSTICSDKTGTLTQNKMTASNIYCNNTVIKLDPFKLSRTSFVQPSLLPLTSSTSSLSTSSSSSSLTIEDVLSSKPPLSSSYSQTSSSLATTLNQLLRIALCCNGAHFDFTRQPDPSGFYPVHGQPSDAALLSLAQRYIPDAEEKREMMGSVEGGSIPFSPTIKFQLSVHEIEIEDEPYFIVMAKGAPEAILENCSTIMIDGNVVNLEDIHKQDIERKMIEFCSLGERVFAFSQLVLSGDEFPVGFQFCTDPSPNFPTSGLTFMGLVSLVDPPRPEVASAVLRCQTAGIKIIMVTGDHPVTAKAIAKQVGIIRDQTIEEIAAQEGTSIEAIDHRRAKAIIITGRQLRGMTDGELLSVLEHEQIVFARTSPQQKLRIVEGCQRLSQIVAVTGDGVNDSPALKKAHIGIAMGQTGTKVAQEAADMILLDDNFASIVKGIEEGRLIFDNLKKSIAYTLSSNIPEIAPFLCFIVLGIPVPLTIVLVLCVDLGTDLVPAISLAYERAETDIMKRRPRDSHKDKLVTWKLLSFSYLQIGVIQALAGLFTFVVVMGYYGFPPSSLPGIVQDWEDRDKILIINNRAWDFDDREEILAHAQTAYFVSIVITQIADALICKTRKLSLFQLKRSNPTLNFGLLSEIFLALIICYVPLFHHIGSRPILFWFWFTGIPFCILMVVYDEIRKYIIRKRPGGWVDKNTFY